MTPLLFTTAAQPSHMRSPVSSCTMPPDTSARNCQKGSGIKKDCCLFPTSTSHLLNIPVSSVLENPLRNQHNIWDEWKDKLFDCQKQQGSFSDVNEILTTNVDALRGELNRIQSCPGGEWSHQSVIRLSEALSVSGTLWLEFGQCWICVPVEEFNTSSKKNNQAQTSWKRNLEMMLK